LAEAAARAETAIKSGQDGGAAIQALCLALDRALANVWAAIPDNSGNGNGRAPGDPVSVREPLIRLKRLLESNDGEAADFIVDAKAHLTGVLTPAEIKALTDQVGNFEFDAALKSLSGIASRLSINIEGT
jgi:hypothetical protein